MIQTRTGLITYSTPNIGDDIQALAISRMMPALDFFIDRERISQYRRPVKAVIGGWYKQLPEDWPPHPNIIPLFLAFHAAKPVCVEQHVEYLRSVGPIGCRDQATLRLCERLGIESYFSGCVTLTLSPIGSPPSYLPIFVDAPVPEGVPHRRYTIAVGEKEPARRLLLAQRRLELMASASCAVTSRLHVALPCAAMGIPVLLIPPPNDGRFEGLKHLVNHIDTYDEAVVRDFVSSPKPNPNEAERLTIATNIRERIANFFTGCAPGPIFPNFCGTPIAIPLPNHKVDPKSGGGGDGVSALKYIPGGCLSGRGLEVLDERGHMLGECAETRKVDGDLPLVVRRRFRGSVLKLGGLEPLSNRHFLLDLIGLRYAEVEGKSIEDFDQFAVHDSHIAAHRDLLVECGIPPEKLLASLSDGETLVCDELTIAPTVSESAVSPQDIYWIRNLLIGNRHRGKGRRLFLATEQFIDSDNSELLRTVLSPFGVEILDVDKYARIHYAFGQAELIIGYSSDILSYVMFCEPGSHMIEINPPNELGKYGYLAELAGVAHDVLFDRPLAAGDCGLNLQLPRLLVKMLSQICN